MGIPTPLTTTSRADEIYQKVSAYRAKHPEIKEWNIVKKFGYSKSGYWNGKKRAEARAKLGKKAETPTKVIRRKKQRIDLSQVPSDSGKLCLVMGSAEQLKAFMKESGL